MIYLYELKKKKENREPSVFFFHVCGGMKFLFADNIQYCVFTTMSYMQHVVKFIVSGFFRVDATPYMAGCVKNSI